MTFYSYKGGVGRTFILASVAVILAEWGRKVLCLDWDLEAPGLAHYLRDWIPDEHGGLVDITEALASPGVSSTNWRDHVVPIDIPGQLAIDLLPAGSPQDYTERVQQINWEQLYEYHNLGSFLEKMREEIVQAYDIVLIDSRTGVTDAGGICTVQFPDLLAMVLTATEQSLEGTLDIGTRIAAARDRLPVDRLALPILPLLSRFDAREERQLSEHWIDRIAKRLGPLYSPWLPPAVNPRQVLERTAVPYVSYWSFGEGIPALEERATSPEMVSWSLETIAALIANGLGDVSTLLGNRDLFVSSARLQKSQEKLTHDIYLSCSRRDLAIGKDLAGRFTASGLNVAFETDNSATGGSWTDRLQQVLASSRHLVVLVTEQLAKAQEQEVRQFLVTLIDRTADSRVVIIRGTRAPEQLPPVLASFPVVQLTDAVEAAITSVMNVLGIQSTKSAPEVARVPIPTRRERHKPDSPSRDDPSPQLRTHTVVTPLDRQVQCPICGLRVNESSFLDHLDRQHGARALGGTTARPAASSTELSVWAIHQTLSRPPIELSREQLRELDARVEGLVPLIAAGRDTAAEVDLMRNTMFRKAEANAIVTAIRERIDGER